MGIKSLFLIAIIVVLGVFSLQNLQSISLVFFGFTSLALPLSIWILLSIFAGLISSLLIQLLSNNSSNKSNSRSSYSPPAPQNYRPEPPAPIAAKPSLQKQPFNPATTSEYRASYRQEFDEFADLDDRPLPESEQYTRSTNIRNNNQNQEVTSFTSQPSATRETEDLIPEQTKTDSEPEVKTPESNPTTPTNNTIIAEEPSEAWLKSRQASPYSYQPREKTEVKIPSPPPPTIKQTPTNKQTSEETPEKRKTSRTNSPRKKSGIYDAPYRVIAPRRNEPIKQNNEADWDEDDDWDF